MYIAMLRLIHQRFKLSNPLLGFLHCVLYFTGEGYLSLVTTVVYVVISLVYFFSVILSECDIK